MKHINSHYVALALKINQISAFQFQHTIHSVSGSVLDSP